MKHNERVGKSRGGSSSSILLHFIADCTCRVPPVTSRPGVIILVTAPSCVMSIPLQYNQVNTVTVRYVLHKLRNNASTGVA